MSFDTTLFNFFHSLAGKSGFIDAAAIFFGDYLGYFVVLAAILLMIVSRDWRTRFYETSLVVLSLILARGILTPLIKFLVQRSRPYEVLEITALVSPLDSAAFPSGHAAFFFALAAALFLINRRIGWGFGIAALVIGISRIIMGVHWPLDILGGALLGIASVLLVREILEKQRSVSFEKTIPSGN